MYTDDWEDIYFIMTSPLWYCWDCNIKLYCIRSADDTDTNYQYSELFDTYST